MSVSKEAGKTIAPLKLFQKLLFLLYHYKIELHLKKFYGKILAERS
jgi:hypothetical protein